VGGDTDRIQKIVVDGQGVKGVCIVCCIMIITYFRCLRHAGGSRYSVYTLCTQVHADEVHLGPVPKVLGPTWNIGERCMDHG
jgi:hypothetical protein